MSFLEVVLAGVLTLIVVAAATSWLLKKDTEMENARRAAARLAATLSNLGLKKTPEFLIDFSVSDVSSMARKIIDLTKLFLAGESAVTDEFAKVFDNALTAKLATGEGRAYIAARLADAAKPADPAVVQTAPKPAVVAAAS